MTSQLSFEFALHQVAPLFLLFGLALLFRVWLIDQLVIDLEALDSLGTSGQPKVTDLDGTVIIDQNVGWFEVSVQDVGRVQVLHALEQVVHNGLHMHLS